MAGLGSSVGVVASFGKLGMISSRRANNGVSRYPSYQKIFQLAENFQNVYRTLSTLDKFSLKILSILQNFL